MAVRRETAGAATTAADLDDVLESETHVDMDKLLSLCRTGVPERLRGEAWKYLLGVSKPEKSEEMSLWKHMEQEYQELERAWQAVPQSELTRRIKDEIRRYRTEVPFFRDARTHQRLERVLRCYLWRRGEDFCPGMVHVLGPFAQVYASDSEAYYCFQQLMKKLEWSVAFEGCKQMTVTFMTLLRHTLPELYFYFEEQCSGGSWLTSWLQFLLARELPLPCVLRLWDTYFSLPSTARQGALQELHVFVCLAILEQCVEELMELDDADLLWYLQHLPVLDMGQVITQAQNLRDEVLARGIL